MLPTLENAVQDVAGQTKKLRTAKTAVTIGLGGAGVYSLMKGNYATAAAELLSAVGAGSTLTSAGSKIVDPTVEKALRLADKPLVKAAGTVVEKGVPASIPAATNPDETTSSDVHNIAVPFGTDIADLHQALLDDYAIEQPTEAGAIENQDSFREAARKAIQSTKSNQQEAGFVLEKSGHYENVPQGSEHSMQVAADSDYDAATLHVHPSPGFGGSEFGPRVTEGPSANDVALSKKSGVPFYISTKTGLYRVRPSDGHVDKIFDRANWAEKNYKSK
jgi:hypothetical protein